MAATDESVFQAGVTDDEETPSRKGEMAGEISREVDNPWKTGLVEARKRIVRMWRKDGAPNDRMARRLEEHIGARIRSRMQLEATNRYEMREDEKYYTGDIVLDDNTAREQPALREIKMKIIAREVDTILGLLSEHETVGEVVSVASYDSEDPDEQKLHESIANAYEVRLKMIQDQVCLDMKKRKALADCVTCGAGYLHHGMTRAPDGWMDPFAHVVHYTNVVLDTANVDTEKPDWGVVFGKRPLSSAVTEYADSEWKRRRLTELAERRSNILSADLGLYDPIYDYGGVTAYGYRWQESLLEEETDEADEMVVTIGDYYFKDMIRMEDGKLHSTTMHVRVAVDRDFNRVLLLGEPKLLYFHNEVPIIPMYAKLHPVTRMPYSNVIRNMRGLERAATTMLRNLVVLVGSRGAVVNLQDHPGSANWEKVLDSLSRRIANPNYVIPEFGPTNSVRIEHHNEDIGKLLQGLETLSAATESGSSAHPAIRGQRSSVSAGRALEGLRDDVLRGHVGLVDALDSFVANFNRQTLANIQQFNSVIRPSQIRYRSRMEAVTPANMETIRHNRATFHVPGSRRGVRISSEALNFVREMMALMPEGTPMTVPLLVHALKNMNFAGSNTDELVEGIVNIALQEGLPVPPGMLTTEQRQLQQQVAEQKAEQQRAMMEMEMAKAQAEMAERQTTAQRNMADAQLKRRQAVEPQGEENKKLRDEVARLSKGMNGG